MMPNRPSLKRLMIQAELNKFYSHPVARLSVGLVLTIIAISFFALAAIKPTLETMADLIKQIEEKRTVDQKLSLKITALSNAQAELAAKGQSAQILDEAIPPTPRFTSLLKMMEKLASEQQVTFVSLVVPSIPTERDPAKSGTELESIPLTVAFTGSYKDLYAVLTALQNMRRLLIIDRVDIVPVSEKDNDLLNLSVSMRAFAFALKPQQKKATSP